MNKQINFDMDGTIADLYGVEGWLSDLIAEKTRPYREARPLVNMSALARRLNRLQREVYTLTVISWASKNGSAEYNELVRIAKLWWLHKHLPSVSWDMVVVTAYGEPKHEIGSGILFDDNKEVREGWTGADEENVAYDVDSILEILKGLE